MDMALYLIYVTFIVTCFSIKGFLCDCIPPQDVANASYYPVNTSYAENTTVLYNCHINFVLSGKSEITCVSDTWQGTLPTCTEVCPSPRELPNAYIISRPPYFTGTTVLYQCQARFEMSGTGFMSCSESYTWLGEPPSCNQVNRAPYVHNSNVYFYGEEGSRSGGSNTEDGSTEGTEEEGSPFIEDDGLIPVIVFGALLGLLLLGMIIFFILRLCCCGDMCNCCGPGGRYAVCGACCMGTLGCGQAAGFSSDQSGCRRWCCCCCRNQKKPKRNGWEKMRQAWKNRRGNSRQGFSDIEKHPQEPKQSQFQAAISRVMGTNRRQKPPKQVEGWMPHSHRWREDHFTSTK